MSILGTPDPTSQPIEDDKPTVSFAIDGNTAHSFPAFPALGREIALMYASPALNPAVEHELVIYFNGTADIPVPDSQRGYEFEYLSYNSGTTYSQENTVDPLTDMPSRPRVSLRVGLVLSISAACLLVLEIAIAILLLRWYRKRKRQTHLLRTMIPLPMCSTTSSDDSKGARTPSGKTLVLVGDRPQSLGSERSLEVNPPLSPWREDLVVPPKRQSNAFRAQRHDFIGHTMLERVIEESEQNDEESDSLSYMSAATPTKSA